jgi:hypothetical protein
MQIQEGNILKSSFWPEKVRVISAKIIGESQIKVEAVGLETNRFYNPFFLMQTLKALKSWKRSLFFSRLMVNPFFSIWNLIGYGTPFNSTHYMQ